MIRSRCGWRNDFGRDHVVGDDRRGFSLRRLPARPLHPLPFDVPDGTPHPDAVRMLRDTDLGRGGGPRWLVDLGALAEGRADALTRIDP